MRILGAYIAPAPPPEEAAVTTCRNFFTAFYRGFVKMGSGATTGMPDDREGVLEILAGQGLITDLRDRDLDAAKRPHGRRCRTPEA